MIVGILGVLSTIDLDDQFFLATDEIDNIREDGCFANEFEPAHAPVTQCEPQFRFRVR